MENPLAFLGAVLLGLGVIELALGPFIARLFNMPPGSAKAFAVSGAVMIPLGVVLFVIGTRFLS